LNNREREFNQRQLALESTLHVRCFVLVIFFPCSLLWAHVFLFVNRNSKLRRLLAVPFCIVAERARNSRAKKPNARAINSAARLERGGKTRRD